MVEEGSGLRDILVQYNAPAILLLSTQLGWGANVAMHHLLAVLPVVEENSSRKK